MNQPLISVIVTCYNQEASINKTLDSVKNQTFTNWECIVVDDGSTDGGAAIIKDLAKSDSRFIYKYQENSGVANARNIGFKLATGTFINFLDGDDTFLPKKLEHQLNVFDEHPNIFICICDHQHYIENTKKVVYYPYETLNHNPLEQLVYKWQIGVAFPQHAPLYKKSLWSNNELPYPIDYAKRSEDWVFNVLVALKEKPYYFLNKVLCTYHHDGNNFTKDVMNSAVSAIHAAMYLNPYLPKNYQVNFIDHTIRKSMNRYLESQRPDILRESGNWRLGNLITKPLFNIKKSIRKGIEKASF